ncbi:kinase-like domain-containing protein [Gymnopilus junonius]|uniref:non-specific serine/threonine protein kinase n=1 Tax=Gymnopilus junonius TaxID=109634 RepID=A0A9P5NQW4_GYMJU|nr:kinase-like domain-containing protein [Gymnopilus junonius]
MSLFPEEQLDSPAGYFAAKPGQTPDKKRWTIVRKLGWGPRSSTWLAFDNGQERHGQYGAIKILTVAATEDGTGANELDIFLGPMQNVRRGVPELLGHFYERNPFRRQRHLCFVFGVLGPSVEDLRLSKDFPGQCLPLHVVQKVIGDVSERLVSVGHHNKVVHGAVTADNFLVETARDIRDVLAESPNESVKTILGSDGILYPSVKSQPIDHDHKWDTLAEDIMHAQIYLNNYAHASRIAKAVQLYLPKHLLPPEALQGEKIDIKSDIWMLGCTTYHLLTGEQLFSEAYVNSPVETATETLKNLQHILDNSNKIEKKDIPATASFLRSCLAIKPSQRPNAVKFLKGDWVRTSCSCEWHDYNSDY